MTRIWRSCRNSSAGVAGAAVRAVPVDRVAADAEVGAARALRPTGARGLHLRNRGRVALGDDGRRRRRGRVVHGLLLRRRRRGCRHKLALGRLQRLVLWVRVGVGVGGSGVS